MIQNLHISHLELRDENSSDIVPYINKRKVDIILVPLSNELLTFKERYIFIMDPHVKFLIRCNVLKGQTANISKGRVIIHFTHTLHIGVLIFLLFQLCTVLFLLDISFIKRFQNKDRQIGKLRTNYEKFEYFVNHVSCL